MPPLPPISIVSAPPLSYTALFHCDIYSVTFMSQACCTRVIVGGGCCPTQVSPPCLRHAYSISVIPWRSMFPPGHYTPQLGIALAPPLLVTPSGKPWACRPRFPLLPPVLELPSQFCSGFGSVYPVAPRKIFTALRAADPHPLSLLVFLPHTCHLQVIGFF